MEDLKNLEKIDVVYGDGNIITLEGLEHIRRRPGMYIGKLGDGSHADDGIYVLLKEVIDNSIDEFRMGHGKTIEIRIENERVSVRDYGRGIPLNSVVKAVSIMNTGGKFDSQVFKKSVGLNGVGTKAVNALSSSFMVESYREGKSKKATFSEGKLVEEQDFEGLKKENGTLTEFIPDATLFPNYEYRDEFVETMLRNYAYLNTGLVRKYDFRIALSHRSPQGRRHRNSLYPQQSVWRRVLFIRQRTAHHPGRYASERIP